MENLSAVVECFALIAIAIGIVIGLVIPKVVDGCKSQQRPKTKKKDESDGCGAWRLFGVERPEKSGVMVKLDSNRAKVSCNGYIVEDGTGDCWWISWEGKLLKASDYDEWRYR